MNKLISILISLFLSFGALMALTPKEKQEVTKARDSVREHKAFDDKAKAEIINAWDYASQADTHAWETEAKIAPLEKQIKDSHDNEQTLANQVQKYKPFWDSGHKFWGLGAVALGFGILFKHVLILIGVLVVLALIIWAASFFFPALGPVISLVRGFFSRLWNSISKRIKK